LLTDGPGWRWVFFVNVPVGVLAAVLAPRLLPAGRRPAGGPGLDVPGASVATLGLALLVYGLSQAPSWGWAAPLTWTCLVAALACLAAFVWIERRARAPLLRLGLLRSRRLAIANLVALLTTAALAPQVFVLTLYLQGVEGFSAGQTGLLFLVQGAAAILGAVLGSRGIARLGVRPLLVGGRLAATVSLLLLVPLPGRDHLPVLLVALGLLGLGNVCTFVACSVAATHGVASGDLGVASGMLYTAQQVGSALGISILVALAATRTAGLQADGLDPTSALVDGFRWALGGSALLSAIATLSGLVAPPRPPAAEVAPVVPEDQRHAA
jgi:predicted MFS family arabinose efflux permease